MNGLSFWIGLEAELKRQNGRRRIQELIDAMPSDGLAEAQGIIDRLLSKARPQVGAEQAEHPPEEEGRRSP